MPKKTATKPEKKTATKPEKKPATKKTSKHDWDAKEYVSDKGYVYLEGMSPAGRIVYPALSKSRLSFNGQKNKQNGIPNTPDDYEFQVTLIMGKDDPILKAMTEKARDAMKRSFNIKKDSELNTKIKNGGLTFPLKDGDILFKKDKVENKHYKDTVYMSLRVKETHPDGLMILGIDNQESVTVKSDFYDGCYCVANIKFAPYKSGRNEGLTVYWDMIRKVADGDKIERKKVARQAKSFSDTNSNVVIGKDGKVKYA